ncbi:MAG TPA: DUF2059 domain-containing protein [Flavobacterium sp.]|nr:DUF2059 domain-containing protein [Flavobacterium sp.]
MKRFLTLLVVVATIQFGFSQDDSFKKDVLKFMEMSGATSPIKSVAEQIKTMVPEEQHEEFQKDFDATLPSLFSKIADAYMEEFTHKDIKQILAFYESEVGKKLSAKQGIMYDKAEQAGEHWGLDLQMVMMKYMQE